MAKDPVFPLYYNDIDRTCKTWTDEEYGCYVRLLVEQWDKGGLPLDPQRLTRLATSVDKNWPLLKSKFEERDGQLKNQRLEEIREEKEKHKQRQRDNAVKRYQKVNETPAKHLPLEGEDEREDELKIKKGVPFFENHEDVQLVRWEEWGNQIVDELDFGWDNMRGRKVSREEMDCFLSVAARNKWDMDSQQQFRTALRGFDAKTGTTRKGKLTNIDNL